MMLTNKSFWLGVIFGAVMAFFVCWFFIGKLFSEVTKSSSLGDVSVLSQNVVLTQDGLIVGELSKGARLYLGEDIDTITRLSLTLGFESDAFPDVSLLSKSDRKYAFTEIIPTLPNDELSEKKQ